MTLVGDTTLFPQRNFVFAVKMSLGKAFQNQCSCPEPDVPKMFSFLPIISRFLLEEDIFDGRYGVRQIMVILRSFRWACGNG